MKIKTNDRINGAQLSCLTSCPHCAISRPQIVLLSSPDPVRANDGSSFKRWSIYRCTSCSNLILAKGQPDAGIANPIIVEIFPDFNQAHEDLPAQARRYLEQAMQTLAAPDASAVMSGSAVDAMLKELGYAEGSVYARIDRAVAEYKITQGMGEWAHSVRLGANRPRHADKDDPHVSKEEAEQSLEFAEALGNFLFVLAAKINRGIKAAQKP